MSCKGVVTGTNSETHPGELMANLRSPQAPILFARMFGNICLKTGHRESNAGECPVQELRTRKPIGGPPMPTEVCAVWRRSPSYGTKLSSQTAQAIQQITFLT
ncbi:hypothetical protein HPB49_008223 [Dermacentor silvarum]|uniref:Uncharacterized protein n=1 Tax=Dermacentor silvarum TaxID=543639 RepID=A0ACB8DB31_DERSI|nr:hypothetical protein HPB49_008223 [Dermacentor silvarum]